MSHLTLTSPACASHDADLWHSTHPGDQARAIRICGTCPATDACREHIERTEAGEPLACRHGIYAGLTPEQRHRLDPARRTSSNVGGSGPLINCPGCGTRVRANNHTAERCALRKRIRDLAAKGVGSGQIARQIGRDTDFVRREIGATPGSKRPQTEFPCDRCGGVLRSPTRYQRHLEDGTCEQTRLVAKMRTRGVPLRHIALELGLTKGEVTARLARIPTTRKESA